MPRAQRQGEAPTNVLHPHPASLQGYAGLWTGSKHRKGASWKEFESGIEEKERKWRSPLTHALPFISSSHEKDAKPQKRTKKKIKAGQELLRSTLPCAAVQEQHPICLHRLQNPGLEGEGAQQSPALPAPRQPAVGSRDSRKTDISHPAASTETATSSSKL